MKSALIMVLSLVAVCQLFSSGKVKEFDLVEGSSASEAFRQLESAMIHQTSENLIILISPAIAERKCRAIRLRNLPPSTIIDILCDRLRVSHLQHGDIVIVAENDESIYRIKKTLRIDDEEIVRLREMIENSTVIVIVKRKDGSEIDQTAIIADILKKDPDVGFDYKAGDVLDLFPPIFRSPRQEGVSYGDGNVIFFFDNPPRWKYRVTYEDGYLLRPKGVSLAELRKLIEASGSRDRRRRQPDYSPVKLWKSIGKDGEL